MIERKRSRVLLTNLLSGDSILQVSFLKTVFVDEYNFSHQRWKGLGSRRYNGSWGAILIRSYTNALVICYYTLHRSRIFFLLFLKLEVWIFLWLICYPLALYLFRIFILQSKINYLKQRQKRPHQDGVIFSLNGIFHYYYKKIYWHFY